MIFTKKGKNIIISDIQRKELFAFLKLQATMAIVFMNSEGNITDDTLILGQRLVKSNKQCIMLGNDLVDYSSILKRINTKMIEGLKCCILMDKNIFDKKQSLIALLPTIKEKIIESCVFIDYIEGMYCIVNKKFPDNTSDSFYYWEDNNSLILLGRNGPVYMKDNPKINSIEDLLCD